MLNAKSYPLICETSHTIFVVFFLVNKLYTWHNQVILNWFIVFYSICYLYIFTCMISEFLQTKYGLVCIFSCLDIERSAFISINIWFLVGLPKYYKCLYFLCRQVSHVWSCFVHSIFFSITLTVNMISYIITSYNNKNEIINTYCFIS